MPMTDTQIAVLKEVAKRGDVYWLSGDGECKRVLGVKLEWVEFADQPDLTEPAAILEGTVPVALYNEEASQFGIMQPLFPPVAVSA